MPDIGVHAMRYLGADGGGTHTTLLLADERGRCLSRATTGSLNHRNIGMARVRERLAAVLAAPPMRGEALTLCVGSSALDGPADDATARAYADGVLPPERLLLTSDLHAALMGLTLGAPGLMVVSGTGSMAALLDASGALRVAGGWGATLHDSLSGYTLAREGLLAAIRAWEADGEETSLCEAAIRFFRVGSPRGLIAALYDPPMPVEQLAAFGAEVLQAARACDTAAMAIVGRELAGLSATVIRLARQEPTLTKLGLYGGVFQHNGWIRSAFTRRLTQALPALKLTEAPLPPEAGAVALALQRDGLWNDGAAANLIQTMGACPTYECE